MSSILGGALNAGTFLERYILGFALGTAAAPALEPYVASLTNEAWSTNTVVPPSVYALAQGVAQGQISVDQARTWAHERGFSDTAFDALTAAAKHGPGIGEAYRLYRRGIIDAQGFSDALLRMGLEDQWIVALDKAKDVLLSPAELANARQQGFMTPAETTAEAGLQGISPARAEVQYELAGLPPGVETGLEMLRRGIIDESTFAQIVREGHTKTKYTADLLALKDHVLSAAEYATLHLKGWITTQEMYAGGALTGYSPAEMDNLYLARGRPAAPGQMWTAIARGIDGPDGRPMDEAQFLKGVKESDIRPEWGPMLYAIRYLYPSLFQLTRLVTSGAIDATTAADWAHKARYAPEVVTALEQAWSGGGTSKADPHVTKAANALWSATHRSYVGEESDVAAATTALDALGIDSATQAEVFRLWDAERALIRRQLTPTEVKKAYKGGVTNPATGSAWTITDAMAALLDRGYSADDATTFLEL